MEMANNFGKHGVQVGAEFDLHMIQICKPEKAASSLSQNPERAALMPKFITTFTQIRMLRYGRTMIEALVIALAHIIQVQSAAWYVRLTDRVFGARSDA